MALRKVLLTDKASFLLTVLLGAVAWSITHIVDRITSAPTVEYSVVIQKGFRADAPNRTIVTLQNLSSKTSFENVTVILRKKSPSDVLTFIEDKSEAAPQAPMWASDVAIAEQPAAVAFNIPILAPHNKIVLSVEFNGSDTPAFTARTRPNSNDSILFREPSLATFLVKHETPIIALLLCLFVLAIIVLLWFEARETQARTANSEHVSTHKDNV